jgi:hypothetical protein
VIRFVDFLKFIHHLNAIASEQVRELGSVEVRFIKTLGRDVFVPEELFLALRLRQVTTST